MGGSPTSRRSRERKCPSRQRALQSHPDHRNHTQPGADRQVGEPSAVLGRLRSVKGLNTSRRRQTPADERVGAGDADLCWLPRDRETPRRRGERREATRPPEPGKPQTRQARCRAALSREVSVRLIPAHPDFQNRNPLEVWDLPQSRPQASEGPQGWPCGGSCGVRVAALATPAPAVAPLPSAACLMGQVCCWAGREMGPGRVRPHAKHTRTRGTAC